MTASGARDRRLAQEPEPQRAFAQGTAWATLLWRLPRSGLLSADSATIARIVREARPAGAGSRARE